MKTIVTFCFIFFSFLTFSQVQIGQDIDGEASEDESGNSISISADGTIVAIGAPNNDGNGERAGHVRVFENQQNVWVQIGQDIDGENLGDFSGESIDLSADGTIIAIGAPGNNGNGQDSGHVRIFEIQGNIWTQTGQDIDGEEIEDFFGSSVSLSADGTIVAIGGPGNNGNGQNLGHVRVFEIQENIWTQIGQDIDGEFQLDVLGSSVSLTSNGTILAIGAPGLAGPGLTKIYKNQGGIWVQIGTTIIGENNGDQSGNSVSLSDNGTSIAIGAMDATNIDGFPSGHVRIFDLSDLLSTEESTITQFHLFPNPTSDVLNIQLQQGTILETINIYNNLGQFIQSSKELIVDTSDLAQGIYFIEVNTNQGKSSKKLVIE